MNMTALPQPARSKEEQSMDEAAQESNSNKVPIRTTESRKQRI